MHSGSLKNKCCTDGFAVACGVACSSFKPCPEIMQELLMCITMHVSVGPGSRTFRKLLRFRKITTRLAHSSIRTSMASLMLNCVHGVVTCVLQFLITLASHVTLFSTLSVPKYKHFLISVLTFNHLSYSKIL